MRKGIAEYGSKLAKANSGETRRRRVDARESNEIATRTTASTPASCVYNQRNSGVPSEYTYY